MLTFFFFSASLRQKWAANLPYLDEREKKNNDIMGDIYNEVSLESRNICIWHNLRVENATCHNLDLLHGLTESDNLPCEMIKT